VRARQVAPVALIIGLTVAGFFAVRGVGQREARVDSNRRAEVATAEIRGRIEEGSSLAESLRRSMVSATGTGISAEDFERNASRWLSPAGFPAAAWVEQVPASRRAAYELRVGHPIVTRNRHLRIVPVGSRSSYLPATLVSGIPPLTVPGIDLGGESGVAAAGTRAVALDQVRATPFETLRDGSTGLFLVSSVPRSISGAVEPGFVVLFVSESSLLAATDTAPLQLTVGDVATGDLGGASPVRKTFTAAGQRFDVAVPQQSIQGAAAVVPWIILAGGLALAALACALGLIAARRAKAKAEADRLFTISADLIAVAGFDGFWTRVNPAFEGLLGYAEWEALARPYLDFVHPDDREQSEAQAARLVRGETIPVFEIRMLCKDGSYRWIEWKATPVLEERLLYAVGRDVTERRQADAELARLAGEQAALRRVATLVARGGSPAEVFSTVAEEVERLLDAEATAIARLEPDGTMAIVASGGTARDELPVGTRLELDSDTAMARVLRAEQSARVDDFDTSSALVAQLAGRLGIRCSVAVPIIVEGALWGSIGAGTNRAQFPVDAEQRMLKFTELAGTAIANADSRDELAASRRRIVAASDEARRRIERDLHDGTQQRLVTLMLSLAAVREAAPTGEVLIAELSRIQGELASALDELREMSRGIHPSILSEGGLGPALRALARRSAIPVELDVTTERRLAEPIEAAVYFVASEALANATKHAHASRIDVSLAPRDAGLVFSIRDDGVGGADPARGSGLVGLHDRVEALGGTIRIESSPGAGTLVVVALPLEVEPVGLEGAAPSSGGGHEAPGNAA
jgi:PAS domain S-box-containing protein